METDIGQNSYSVLESEVETKHAHASKNISTENSDTFAKVNCQSRTISACDNTDDECVDRDSEMFDESECFGDEDLCNDRCKLLQKISCHILDIKQTEEYADETDHLNEAKRYSIAPLLVYLNKVTSETRTKVALYLSTGDLEHVSLNINNIHDFYHVASSLCLKQLRDHCERFCSKHNQEKILACFEGCDCRTQINKVSASGYKRLESVLSRDHENDTPQYYIIFYGTTDSSNMSHSKKKVFVQVIDMFERCPVFSCELGQFRHIGEGFSCCSCEIKESPFVFVNGGDGKNSHTLYKYDVILGRWEKRAKTLHGRSFHMMVSFGSDSIFVIGGKEVSCIEEYNIKHNKWCERASLVTHVTSAACILYETKIYIFGGKTEAGPVSAVQCYDVYTHVTSRCQDLPCSFEGGQAVLVKNRIYIATDQGHMICFDPNSMESWLCSHVPIKLTQFGMFYKTERIFFVGGVRAEDNIKSDTIVCYRYNPDKNTWTEENDHCQSFPVYGSCVINYPKTCYLIPFNDKY